MPVEFEGTLYNSVCTVTFDRKGQKLNSIPVYCSQLYGMLLCWSLKNIMDNFLNFPDLLKFLEFPELTDLSYLLDFPDIPTLHQTASIRLKYIHCNPVLIKIGRYIENTFWDLASFNSFSKKEVSFDFSLTFSQDFFERFHEHARWI